MQANGIEFAPMIYGNCCGIDDLPGSLPDTAKTLLGFNEPNHWCASALLCLGPDALETPSHRALEGCQMLSIACREESGLQPAEAAQLWPKLQAAAQKRNLRLGSPAAAPCGTNCIMNSPFDWWLCPPPRHDKLRASAKCGSTPESIFCSP